MSMLLGGTSLLPTTAHAQFGYGSEDEVTSGSGDADASEQSGDLEGRGDSPRRGSRNEITPYIEVQQIARMLISGSDPEFFDGDVLTYTQVTAGVEARVAGRNNALSASVRYERRFGWNGADSEDTVSGVLRGYASVVPRTLRIDAGALASRLRTENNGAAVLAGLAGVEETSQVYSGFIGPALTTNAGEVKIDGHYRIGYTKTDSADTLRTAQGPTTLDVLDKSIVHDAEIRASTRPGVGLPVGLGARARYYREDISNLDQRIDDFSALGDVTVPIAGDLALVGGVGYERVEVSSRDALIGDDGLPATSNGRLVSDKSRPRQIAYESNGLIWDAGVIWKPSRRTQLEAHVGRRYGTIGYYGTLSYAPNDRTSLNVVVYDNVSGFGGQVNRALASLSSEFSVIRNPITGDISGCSSAALGGGCLANALGSIRSATFRARGVQANYNFEIGRTTAGFGAGYDRRRFIAAEGTILAAANGVVDENYWLNAYMTGQLGQNGQYSAIVYGNWFRAGSASDSNTTTYGATLAYYRNLTDHLVASAALGIDSITRQEPLDDQLTGSALVGLRYSF